MAPRRAFTPEYTQREIVARYTEGQPMTKIATDLTVSRESVIKFVKAAGVWTRRKPIVDTAAEERMVMLYKRGDSMGEVAQAVGVAESTVDNALKKAGVPKRGVGRRSKMVRNSDETRAKREAQLIIPRCTCGWHGTEVTLREGRKQHAAHTCARTPALV